MEFLGQVALETKHEGVKDVPKTPGVISTLLFSFLLTFIPRIHNSETADPKQFRFWQAILCST